MTDAKIMLLEDEPLIAMTTEQMILDLGYPNVDVFYRLDEAQKALGERTYDIAVLDVNVDKNRTSLALAQEAKEAGTRIVFATGNSAADKQLRSLSETVLSKPYSEADIKRALENG